MKNNKILKLFFLLITLSTSFAYGNETNKVIEPNKGTVLITGANRGLGLALSKHFLADGYNVIGTARKPAKATALKEAGAQVVQLDVTDDASINAMASTLKNVPIDIIVNNAGYIGDSTRGIESFKATPRETFLRTYNINAVGPLMVARALLPNLLLSQKAVKKIINISSHGGILDRKDVPAIYAYDVTKTALNRFTLELAKDLKPYNIAVVSLAPGWNKTRMGGEGATLDPTYSTGKSKETIKSITLADTGTFVTYAGLPVKW